MHFAIHLKRGFFYCSTKTRHQICTKPRPMERDFEELQNGTMHCKIECRVKELRNIHSYIARMLDPFPLTHRGTPVHVSDFVVHLTSDGERHLSIETSALPYLRSQSWLYCHRERGEPSLRAVHSQSHQIRVVPCMCIM